jgi:hypothetical protein
VTRSATPEGGSARVEGAHLGWAKGGEARIEKASADAIVLVSSTPWPPGSRIEGTLLAEPRATVKVKVHASKLLSDGTFRIEGRPIDLTKDLRARLEALL